MEDREYKLKYRLVKKSDAQEILDIYTPYITESTITFEYEVPSLDEFEKRIENISDRFPYIVCILDNQIIGYAYAHELSERAAYQWSAELSIYLKQGLDKKGIGSIMYNLLMDILKLQNIKNVYGCITGENERSIKFHENLGFELVGKYKKAGYKFDKWLDVVFYEKEIGEKDENPDFIIPIKDIDKESINRILQQNK